VRFLARVLHGLLLVGGICSQICSQLASADDVNPSVPPILLANVLQPETDVTRYWVSEKYDGVRAIWNGRSLHFRSGRLAPAPAWFTANFPAQPLDGELWLERGGFDRLSAIVRKQQPVDDEWRQVTYRVFELPDAAGSFTERIVLMRQLIDAAHIPWLQQVEQFRVQDREELQRHLSAVLKNRGEGLMLHLADAPYSTGRSDVLLKVKPWLDTEAIVVGHEPGKGKYRGMLGALLLELPDGRRFKLGTGFSDAVRRNPPAIGRLITYRYRELNKNGVPRFASYLRVRETF
jgi:DNA ligase-1